MYCAATAADCPFVAKKAQLMKMAKNRQCGPDETSCPAGCCPEANWFCCPDNGVTPRFYIRILVEMEDLINETWEDSDGRKKMNKNNSKSLGALRQKLRKYIKNEFEDDVAKFRENPDDDDDVEDAVPQEEKGDDDEDSDDESPDKSDFSKADMFKKDTKKSFGDDDESDDSYWDSSGEDESESSPDEDGDQKNWQEYFRKDKDKPDGEKDKDKKEKKVKKGKGLGYAKDA